MTGFGVVAHDELGAMLERQRLEHRSGRLERAVEALRTRVDARRDADGRVPRPLLQALADFERQLRTTEDALRKARARR